MKKTDDKSDRLILLTGATGYIGGRLLPALQLQGYSIRCLVRNPENLRSRLEQSVDIVPGDVLKPQSLEQAMSGVTDAYYLIHSMGAKGSFEQSDRDAARNFADAAKKAGVRRIIYLGGLGNDSETLSAHLRSRQEVGEILRASGIPVVEFRASIVIGSGSLSFEMIRTLVERLPFMITPKWVSKLAQPIAINDLIQYLSSALNLEDDQCRIYEIGGADKVSYADIMRTYAKCRKLPIRMIPVPFLTPYLSSLWLGLITPLYARIGRKLIESIVHSTVVNDESALKVFPINPIGIEPAIRAALRNEDREFAYTRWSDALSSSGAGSSWFGTTFGSRLIDSRTIDVDAPVSAAFEPIRRIGGQTGWYAWNALWWIRGEIDLLWGGVGLRRGRSHDREIRIGDTIDFWRVEDCDGSSRLLLRAEMKVPGRAWLEFQVTGDQNKSTIRQTAIFDPAGLWGRLYWYSLWPIHQVVFSGMLRAIARKVSEYDTTSPSGTARK